MLSKEQVQEIGATPVDMREMELADGTVRPMARYEVTLLRNLLIAGYGRSTMNHPRVPKRRLPWPNPLPTFATDRFFQALRTKQPTEICSISPAAISLSHWYEMLSQAMLLRRDHQHQAAVAELQSLIRKLPLSNGMEGMLLLAYLELGKSLWDLGEQNRAQLAWKEAENWGNSYNVRAEVAKYQTAMK